MSPAVILTSAVWPAVAGELLQYNHWPDRKSKQKSKMKVGEVIATPL